MKNDGNRTVMARIRLNRLNNRNVSCFFLFWVLHRNCNVCL